MNILRPSLQREMWIGRLLTVLIDRPIGSVHPRYLNVIYQCNYGYVPNTLAADGHEIDAYVLGLDTPMDHFEGICIAIIHREDDNEDKLVVVQNNVELSDEEIRSQTNFQEKFFNSSIVR